MAFTAGIPTAPQSLGETVDNVRNNFANYFTVMSVNHVAPNLAGQGKHKFLQMPSQGAAPATAANELGWYVKGTGANTALFLRQQNNGTEIQMSRTVPATVNNANGAGSTTRFTFLPTNLIMITGVALNITDGSTLNFSQALTTVISIHLTALGNSSSGANRALVAQPRTVNAGAATMVVNLQDVNNNSQGSNRTVYFTIIGVV